MNTILNSLLIPIFIFWIYHLKSHLLFYRLKKADNISIIKIDILSAFN